MPWNTIIPNLIVFEELPGVYSGLFGYNPAPGPGNLEFSLAVTDGTDPYGNNYLGGGITVYNGTNAIFLGAAASGTSVLEMFTGASFEGNPPANLFTAVAGAGAAEVISTGISGGKTNVAGFTDWVQLILQSANQGGTNIAQGFLMYIDNSQTAHVQAEWGGPNGFNVVDQDTGFQTWVPSTSYQPSDQNWTSTTPTQNLSQQVSAGHVYTLEAYCVVTIGLVATSFNVGFGGLASLTFAGLTSFVASAQAAAATPTYRVFATPGLGNYSPGAASVNCIVQITATVEPSANGTVSVALSSGTNGDTVTLKAGSYMRVTRIV